MPCFNCHNVLEDGYRCRGCENWYCNPRCEEAHLSAHSKTCSSAQRDQRLATRNKDKKERSSSSSASSSSTSSTTVPRTLFQQFATRLFTYIARQGVPELPDSQMPLLYDEAAIFYLTGLIKVFLKYRKEALQKDFDPYAGPFVLGLALNDQRKWVETRWLMEDFLELIKRGKAKLVALAHVLHFSMNGDCPWAKFGSSARR